ncbi:MAG: bacillithiol biosynthesis cysteine-adding enzyme BshC [Bacteroidetes bacterium]|nr:bacillithiol biosynthesis cysteine-adding enzyme BshC [Bacteroidota bacterium]
MFINFCDIPGHQNLFLDYLYEFDNIKDFYKYDFRNREQYKKIFKSITESDNTVRVRLKSILSSQYADLSPSNKTQKNIDLLAKDNTLTIVTGQQLGMLGGPLYTFYKIITIIKLSNHLNSRYDKFNFVPVFWLEGDDHDFNEVRSISVFNNDNLLKKIGYKEEVEPDDAKKSIGLTEFDESINEFFGQLDENLRDTEFKQPLLDKLKTIYEPGKTFKTSFRQLIHSLFDDLGLVLLDPQDKQIKDLLKPVFRKEINDFREHTQQLVQVSAKLEETYHAQVKVHPVNLFFSTDEGRYSIEPVDNEFRLKRKRKSFTKEELLELIENEPERFSPNVLLRPICQDYILPTAFYVGGPSEVSYFAQVLPLYDLFKIPTPIIYPRSSATLLEANIKKTLDKYDKSIIEIFLGVDELKRNVIDSLTENNVDDIFNETQNEIDIAFDRLREKLFALDKTIADTSKKYRGKIFNALNELKGKAEQAQNRKFEVTLRQLDRASTIIFPAANLQEREINFIYFVNKYGEEFLKKLFDELEIDKFEHQVIEL